MTKAKSSEQIREYLNHLIEAKCKMSPSYMRHQIIGQIFALKWAFGELPLDKIVRSDMNKQAYEQGKKEGFLLGENAVAKTPEKRQRQKTLEKSERRFEKWTNTK